MCYKEIKHKSTKVLNKIILIKYNLYQLYLVLRYSSLINMLILCIKDISLHKKSPLDHGGDGGGADTNSNTLNQDD